jgi:hypothetical protein
MTVDILAELRDAADALTNPSQVRNPRRARDANGERVQLPDHVATLPGLIAQVAEIVWPTGGGDSESARPVPSSRPPGNPQAMALHLDIWIGVSKWHMRWCLTTRDTLESSIRQMVAKVMSEDSDTQDEMLGDLRSWRHRCEVVLREAFNDPQIQSPCPVEGCGNRTLRVNVQKKTARCTTCRARWAEVPDPERGIWSIVGLADHIQTYEAQARAAAAEVRMAEREAKERRYGRSAA